MSLYPGSFLESARTAGYHGIRSALNLKKDGESAHTESLRLAQLLEHSPRLAQQILLGNERFSHHLQQFNDGTWSIGQEQFGSPFLTAAGLLKRHDMVPYGTLAKLPIGAVTLGGITPEARPGNPQPRLFVDEENEGIVNFMGLNNSGAELWAAQIRFEREILGIHHPPLIANIANDPATPMEKKPEEAKKLAIILGPNVSVLDYNGSCPNVGSTSGKAAFEGESLESLTNTLKAIHEGLREIGRTNVSVTLKLPPHLDDAALKRVINATSDLVAGYTCINTSPNQGLKDQTIIGANKGGLSGKLILPEMIRTVKTVRNIAGPDKTIIALGGLGTGKSQSERWETGREAARAGANLVSAYSSLVFHGPGAMRDIIAGFLYEKDRMR